MRGFFLVVIVLLVLALGGLEIVATRTGTMRPEAAAPSAAAWR